MDFDAQAFGRRVSAARAWRGLAAKQLANELGSSDEAIYRLERGERQGRPRKGDLRLLAEALQVSEDWLLNGQEPPWHAPLPSIEERLAEIERTIAEFLRVAIGDVLAREIGSTKLKPAEMQELRERAYHELWDKLRREVHAAAGSAQDPSVGSTEAQEWREQVAGQLDTITKTLQKLAATAGNGA